jgi:hypothetical protein
MPNNLTHKIATAREFATGVRDTLPNTQISELAKTVLDLCDALIIVNEEFDNIQRTLRQIKGAAYSSK